MKGLLSPFSGALLITVVLSPLHYYLEREKETLFPPPDNVRARLQRSKSNSGLSTLYNIAVQFSPCAPAFTSKCLYSGLEEVTTTKYLV